MAGITARSLPLTSETGVTINNRIFYYSFESVMNQGVYIGKRNKPLAPAGCYYILIYNVSEDPSDYSLVLVTR
jgi:hypothetical protein